MKKITPFLWFDKEAEEAAKFYTSVFKNSKIKRVTRYGDAGPAPKGQVMTVDFELDGQPFTALNGGPIFKFNESISFVVHCQDQKEIDYFWEKLTAGGGKEVECGWLKDKYGLSWQIIPAALEKWFDDPKRANSVMKAVLQMKKLDIKKLQDAYDHP
jgi:predicted 3-demethylubiquinone-9 3-methyltransferase (glyoxalase superfamily)